MYITEPLRKGKEGLVRRFCERRHRRWKVEDGKKNGNNSLAALAVVSQQVVVHIKHGEGANETISHATR